MKIIPNRVQHFISNEKTAEFVENTIIAVGTETTLKMIGRPTFILIDKDADSKKKKFAAVKEFLYQAICLGLYFTIVGPIKKVCYKAVSKLVSRKPENAKILKLYENLETQVKKAKEMDKTNNKTKSGSLIQKIKNIFMDGSEVEKLKQTAKGESEVFDICEFNYETKSVEGILDKSIEKLKNYKNKLTPEQLKNYYSTGRFKELLEELNNPKKLTQSLNEIIANVKARKLGKGVHEFGAIFGSVATLAILAPEISHMIIHPLMKALKFEKPENKHE